MRIFLMGYMGSGKTTVGKPLARQLGLEFVDMDHVIADRHGRSVNEIFSTFGEARFREIEREILGELLTRDNIVVSLGGGTPCFFDNLERIKTAGVTVYLQAGVETLARRLEHGKARRPLLRDKSPEELFDFIRDSLAIREQVYSQAAVIVGCDGYSDMQIVDKIAAVLRLPPQPQVVVYS
ncbi:MAG: shikimate kinase [Rikenellaceae bacterium]|jgi:shikimate kinase|nr:shikimate kinase [Rikenellaceae bacterium]